MQRLDGCGWLSIYDDDVDDDDDDDDDDDVCMRMCVIMC